MAETKYGFIPATQISEAILSLRRAIFFLLLCVDPTTSREYSQVDVPQAIRNVQYKLNGMNAILGEPPALLITMSLIEAALQEYQSECFAWPTYRKLILDAGSEILKAGEADD